MAGSGRRPSVSCTRGWCASRWQRSDAGRPALRCPARNSMTSCTRLCRSRPLVPGWPALQQREQPSGRENGQHPRRYHPLRPPPSPHPRPPNRGPAGARRDLPPSSRPSPHSRRDNLISDMARDTTRKISFKPTSRRSSHLRPARPTPNAGPGPATFRRAYARVTKVFGTHSPRPPPAG